jgi:hypothetical protein
MLPSRSRSSCQPGRGSRYGQRWCNAIYHHARSSSVRSCRASFTRDEGAVLGCRKFPRTRRTGFDTLKTLPWMLPLDHISVCPRMAYFADTSTR